MTDLELTRRFFSVFNPPPDVRVEDNDDGPIIIGPFAITKTVNKVKGLGGKVYEVPSYTLDVAVQDDVIDLHQGRLLEVLIHAVEQYAGYLARQIEDAIVTDAQAEDFKAERQLLKDAYNEGYQYYQQTQAGQRSTEANPYPQGIQHYREWLKGYAQADEEAVF